MQSKHNEELILFYNVESFFLPDPKPIHRLDPTKSGLYGWDEKKYTKKLKKITQTFSLVRDEYGKMPFIIGLAEIQGPEVISDLLAQSVFSGFQFVHYKSRDHRGMDVALIYDASKVKILASEVHSFLPKHPLEKGTRDILQCTILFKMEIFNVFIAHFPSRRNHDFQKKLRQEIAEKLYEKIEGLIEKGEERVIVMGDFNANPNEEFIESVKNGTSYRKIMRNPFADLYKKKQFSVFHGKIGLLFDQILFSEYFFHGNSEISFKDACVFNPENRRFKGSNSVDRPFRTYAGSRYVGGYSDHFPVIASVSAWEHIESLLKN